MSTNVEEKSSSGFEPNETALEVLQPQVDTNTLLSILTRISEDCAAQNVMLRRQVRVARITAFFCACLAGAAIFAVMSILPQVDRTLQQAQQVLVGLETATNTINDADIGKMLKNADALVTESRDGLKEALDDVQIALGKIKAINIDALNNAIDDLAGVVKPFTSLFGR